MADPKKAVLVHQLPSDFMADALALIPKTHIGNVEPDRAGLKIFFKNYDTARECILRRIIHVQGAQYTICPLVTNLTLHGIRQYASKLAIRDIMTLYGYVVDLYAVEKISKDGKFEKKSLTDDFRVVLGVPEVQIDFELSHLKLPDLRDRSFAVSFFCRLCRRNGHMQMQCSQVSNGLQVYGEKIPVQMETEQIRVQEGQVNCKVKFNDRFDYRQSEVENANASESFSFESQNGKKYLQHEHATQVNVQDRNMKNTAEPSPMFCKIEDADHTHLHENFSSQTSFGTVQSNMTSECVNYLPEEKISSGKSRPSKPNNLPKSSVTSLWSRITPPNAHLGETKRLLKSVLKEKCLNISPKVERTLRRILEWNHNRGKKYLENDERKFIKWLELYLDEVSQYHTKCTIRSQYEVYNKTQSGHSEEEQVHQPQNTSDDQIFGVEIKKKRRGVLSLCPGIEEIVVKTHGVLDPEVLRNFLNQVRGRKNQMEIAALFEKDFFALAEQLQEVVKSYYFYGKRGAREDGDINFIKMLRKRLMQKSTTTKEEQNCPSEQPSFNKISSSRILSQNYNSKNQNNVNYYKQSEDQTLGVESRKYRRRKYLSSRVQSSRIPKSSPEFCPPKSSKDKFDRNFQSNHQRSSIYDGDCFKKSSAEKKRRKNFRWINKNEVTGLNEDIKYDSPEASERDIETDKRKLNKRSSYPPHYSTCDSSTHHKRNILIDNPTTESRNVVRQPSSAKELKAVTKEVTKSDLPDILSYAQQSEPAEEFRKMTKEHLRQMLSFVHQPTEHSQFERNEGFMPE